MNVVLWIAQIVLAVTFLMAGAMKLMQPYERLAADERMGWVNDVSTGLVRFVGLAEVLGAVGLILPAVTGIGPVLVPLAALGIAAVMVGAIVIHSRRGETQMVVMNAVLGLIALFVAWGRFGDYSF